MADASEDVGGDEPDISLAGLSFWAHPGGTNSSWLDIIARVEAPGSFVELRGPWVMDWEIRRFAEQLEILDRELRGEACLACVEPMLAVTMRAEAMGHIELIVDITPDFISQAHKFTFEIDQTYVLPALLGCKKILSKSRFARQ